MDRRVKERLVGASILVLLIVLVVPELLSGPPSSPQAPAGARLPVSAPEPVRNVTVDLATSKALEPPEAGAAASDARPPEARSPDAASAAAGADASTATVTGTEAGPQTTPALPTTPALSTPALSTNAAPSSDTRPDTRPSNTPPSASPPRAASPGPLETAAPAPISSSAKPAVAGKAWAVQLGSFASRANAGKLAHQLKAQGFSVYVVPGGSGPSLRYRVRIGPMADRGAAAQTVAKLKSAGQAASLVAPAP